jgi:hypothetical protein
MVLHTTYLKRLKIQGQKYIVMGIIRGFSTVQHGRKLLIKRSKAWRNVLSMSGVNI